MINVRNAEKRLVSTAPCAKKASNLGGLRRLSLQKRTRSSIPKSGVHLIPPKTPRTAPLEKPRWGRDWLKLRNARTLKGKFGARIDNIGPPSLSSNPANYA